ncbi:molecular chaperone GrpE [Clostridium frigidicarnis]|uniref:Protein GrpE n=1 Tax=Clostridium frigidicarnis TaxID=84698 RepID=A0A1I0VGQ9_9CLOT|nr:nucleotide exchange factor GrpE [Clostridium frigidicarnis]SFA75554.1 molecular chaperone GrpE [Clostridium frigidicarnis]
MKKKEKKVDNLEEMDTKKCSCEDTINNDQVEEINEIDKEENNCNDEKEQLKSSLLKTKDENQKLQNEIEALKDRLLRTSSEYENYRRRTAKEKEGIYTDACEDVLKDILPVIDNLERAVSIEGSADDIKIGVEMTLKSFETAFEKLNVEEINTNCEFDPNYHNAVMHVNDDSLGNNSIVEVLQKGYKKGDKVLRYSMVKVAN